MSPHPMNPQILGRATTLARGTLQSIADARGTSVQCLQGAIWLTQQGDARDIVLEAGDEARIEHDGLSLLSALSDARFVLAQDSTLPDPRLLARQAQAALATH
jgi:hypothetical protein